MFVHGTYYCVVHWNEQGMTCTFICAWVALGIVYGIAPRELHTCAVLPSQQSTYSLRLNTIRDEGTQRVFAVSIAANPDIILVDLEGVDLSPYVDVLGVSGEVRGSPCDPRARTSATNRAAASEVCKGRN
jgi:hypothetical protein